MLRIFIGSAYDPIEVTVDERKTIKQIFADNNIALAPGAMVALNSTRLGDADTDKPISTLGIKSDDLISVVEKLSSSRI